MTRRVSLACRPEIIELPVERILPVKVLTSNFLASPKYHRIAASVRELREPAVLGGRHAEKPRFRSRRFQQLDHPLGEP